MATIRWKQLYREFEDGGNFTGSFGVSGSIKATGSVNLTGSGAGTLYDTLDVNGRATLKTAAVENLTQGRIVLAGSGSILQDSSSLTYINDTLTATNLNVSNNLVVSGNLSVLGSSTEVIISSSTVEIGDNIIKLNAFSPFKRYAGIEVIDSGSLNNSASLVWDSLNDNWIVQNSLNQSAKIISTEFGTTGNEPVLETNFIPKATSNNTVNDSLLSDDGTRLNYNSGVFTVSTDGDLYISGNISLSGLELDSFVTVNSSGSLSSVTANTIGDLVQWNGTNFIASEIIDGGTF